jgi:hypothetical protein
VVAAAFAADRDCAATAVVDSHAVAITMVTTAAETRSRRLIGNLLSPCSSSRAGAPVG